MALVNEVQVGRPNAVLHKLLSMKEGAPAPQLSPDLQASIVLESDRPEFHFLGGGALCCGTRSDNAGGVGNRTLHCLRNPGGSGVLMVLTRVIAQTFAIASALAWKTAPNFTGAAGNHFIRDTREGINASPAGRIEGDAAHALGAALRVGQLENTINDNTLNNSYALWTLSVVLAPGSSFWWSPDNDNIGMRSTVAWYERGLEPSETR